MELCINMLVVLGQLFGNIGIEEESESAINQHNNFRTFFLALILLFRCVCPHIPVKDIGREMQFGSNMRTHTTIVSPNVIISYSLF